MSKAADRKELFYDVCVDFIFAVVIGINIYIMIDTASEGALSRSIGEKWQSASRQLSTSWHMLADRSKVVQTAEYIANNEGD